MDNLEEMDRFLEKLHCPRLNQEEIEIVTKPIKSTETEAVVKNLTINKQTKQNKQNPRIRWLHRRILSNI